MRKHSLAIVLLIIALSCIAACSSKHGARISVQSGSAELQTPAPTPTQNHDLIYTNTEYGFSVDLPDSWKGYSVIASKSSLSPTGGLVDLVYVPLIVIRHPLWTEENPRQDIPFVIYTLDQWDKIKSEQLLTGCPAPPQELAENAEYVIALPARYNYSYLEGWEEVSYIVHYDFHDIANSFH